ncbi:MAG: biopolymer transporter ExbD [Planctomycetes bacterium]|nr:biopolymer transporter ExbD [Planctomycetota bacterium]
MRIHNPETEQENPVNLMPLIDMVFLLLIFFLVATSFAQEERDQRVKLPVTAAPRPLSAPPRQVIINILRDGTMTVGGHVYDAEKLGALLRRVARSEPDRMVLIRADEMSFHKYFAAAARLCKQAGINELKIGYLEEAPGPQAMR